MADHADTSLGELLVKLAQDTGALVRQELRLASTEMTLKARSAARNLGLVALGGLIALAGILALLGAAIAAIAIALPVWLAALIVGLVVAGSGVALAMKGLTVLRHMNPVPERTLGTMSDDIAWAKEQVR